MPDQPETTVQPAGTQPSSQDQQGTVVPDGYVEKARLDGALQKIQELTLANRALAEQITQRDTSIGNLTAQLATKAAEIEKMTGQHATELGEVKGKLSTAELAARDAEALQRKLKAIKEANHPELVSVLDVLPTAETPEDQLAIVNRLAQFASGLVKRREEELLAGATDGSSGSASLSTAPAPASAEAWVKRINSLPPGSRERQEAWDQYYAFTTSKK
jgi:hypothetical protein